jgi:hypothetical protein
MRAPIAPTAQVIEHPPDAAEEQELPVRKEIEECVAEQARQFAERGVAAVGQFLEQYSGDRDRGTGEVSDQKEVPQGGAA